jgi:hypothetical protein
MTGDVETRRGAPPRRPGRGAPAHTRSRRSPLLPSRHCRALSGPARRREDDGFNDARSRAVIAAAVFDTYQGPDRDALLDRERAGGGGHAKVRCAYFRRVQGKDDTFDGVWPGSIARESCA